MQSEFITIPLNNKKNPELCAIIDAADYDLVSKHRWYYMEKKRGGAYAFTMVNKRTVYLHVFLMNPGPKMKVDHRDHDGLNCRRVNMRVCTHRENLQNQMKQRVITTSRYKGVCLIKNSDRWVAYINFDGRRTILGYFSNEDDAGRAYNDAAEIHFGEFALLNDIVK